MNAVTSRAPKQRKPRPQPERFIRILEQPGPDTDGWAAIAITMGNQVDTYLLHAIPTDFGNGCLAFEVEKLDAHFETAEGIQKLIEIGKLPAEAAHRSAGDMAANDPEAYRQHENDTAGLNTPRDKDRYVAEQLSAMEAEFT